MRKFINADEILILKSRIGRKLICEETQIREYETEFDVITGNEDFSQAWRFDTKELKAEDITEDCAKAWIKAYAQTPDHAVPPFVAGSEAYENFCEDYRIENGFSRRQIERQYSTLHVVHGAVN